jgi:16S rRNA (cytidine1402-2'-O)-methyltransferase
MGDITLRALDVLRSCDAVFCEDTRRTLKLMNHYGIRKPLVSCHEHNERARAAEAVTRLAAGEAIALVSDAGTPGISDPGHIIIEAAIKNGFDVDALPGANAALPALLLSGLPARSFFFAGFAGDEGKQIERTFTELSFIDAALVFYVAPHDLTKYLGAAAKVFAGRPAALAREISKIHQETIRGTVEEIEAVCASRELKGEMVLVIGAGERADRREDAPEWKKLALAMKRAGIFDKDIANALFESYGIPRNEVKTFLFREAPL